MLTIYHSEMQPVSRKNIYTLKNEIHNIIFNDSHLWKFCSSHLKCPSVFIE